MNDCMSNFVLHRGPDCILRAGAPHVLLGMISKPFLAAAKAIQEMGVANVIYWAAASVPALHASHFARTFFASLRDPLSSTLEV